MGNFIALNLILTVLAIFIFLPLVIIITCYLKKQKKEDWVKSTSYKIQKVKELNSSYEFYPIKKRYKFNDRVRSLYQFNSYVQNGLLLSSIIRNTEEFAIIITKVESNKTNKALYDKRYDEIYKEPICLTDKRYPTLTKEYLETEEKILKRLKINPPIATSVNINVSYTTPAGKKHYTCKQVFPYNQMFQIYQMVLGRQKKIDEKREHSKIERSKMSPSLRYDILKRDGFRCQICGATVEDGIKLQVDHIVPVSKGGKTEWSNLRTLCDQCNSGKSDKLE